MDTGAWISIYSAFGLATAGVTYLTHRQDYALTPLARAVLPAKCHTWHYRLREAVLAPLLICTVAGALWPVFVLILIQHWRQK